MNWIIPLELVLAFTLSCIYGYDRQKAHKPIGFGTYIFVTVGSCSLAIAAQVIEPENPLPLLSAAVTGIGFLGAGALIKTTDKVFGFSSAAGVWIFAILGITIGVGQIALSLMLYALIILVILIDKWLEKEGIGSYQRRILIVTNKIIPEKDIESVICIGGVKAKKLNIELNKKDKNLSILFQLEGRKSDINQISQKLYEQPWFASFKVE